MKIHCDVVFDLETGDYEIALHNLSRPGEPMDALRVRQALRAILEQLEKEHLTTSRP